MSRKSMYDRFSNPLDSDEQNHIISSLKLDNIKQENIIKIVLISTNFCVFVLLLIIGGIEKRFFQYFVFSLMFGGNILFHFNNIYPGILFLAIPVTLSLLSFFFYAGGVTGVIFGCILGVFVILAFLEIILKYSEEKYLEGIQELNEFVLPV